MFEVLQIGKQTRDDSSVIGFALSCTQEREVIAVCAKKPINQRGVLLLQIFLF